MHILLTDILTCPRCGPEFGLIVLADRIEDRQVRQGRLGCANCRERYVVEQGVADLRHEYNAPLEVTDRPGAGDTGDRGFRAAALLGAQPANASLLLLETGGMRAPEFAETHPEVHVIAASADPPSDVTEAGVLSRVVAGGRLPFRERAFQGVAILGTPSPNLISEVRRVLSRNARLVVDRAPPPTVDALRKAGFEVHLEQEEIVVAAAPGHG